MQHVDVAVVGLGALGSATAHALARRGARVLALEQFELGHVRGASHDTSRIVRRAYDSAPYVRLADAAYRDWADLEASSGERLVTPTGGVTLCPPGAPVPAAAYAAALTEAGADFEHLGPQEAAARFPAFRLPEGTEAIWDPGAGVVHASRSVAVLQLAARAAGAELRDRCRVLAVQSSGPDGAVLATEAGPVAADAVVLCADAWTDRLLAPLGAPVGLRTMQEQVTYFAPPRPADFAPDRFGVWIWEDDVCFYGFPTYGEPTVKAARDVSEVLMDPEERTFVPSAERLEELAAFVARTLPGAGAPLRTVTCQYALTADRHFVLDAVPGHPRLFVGLGAGHAFKFTPTFGRVLADLATTGTAAEDLSLFRADRPALAGGAVPPPVPPALAGLA